MSGFDPNDVAVDNGNVFGMPFGESEAELVLIPVPFDATTSYGHGTAKGPENIRGESLQLDFYHPDLHKGSKLEGSGSSGFSHHIDLPRVHMLPTSKEWSDISSELGARARKHIELLESGKGLDDESRYTMREMNSAQEALCGALRERCASLLENGKKVGVVGGEHSVPLGLLQALGQQYDGFDILQIDAHADLRPGYEGFDYSHASIMHHALLIPSVRSLHQVGIRDVSPMEMEKAERDNRVHMWTDRQLKEEAFQGVNWSDQVNEILEPMGSKVYVSFDIDGLSPELCPGTGTPVPGGFSLEQMALLLKRIRSSGREIIGFDLCEVGAGTWDGNVGARVLWELCVQSLV